MRPWYWAVGCDNTVENPLVADSAWLGVDAENLEIGVPLSGMLSKSAWLRALKPENDGTPDDVLQNCLGIPVFSSKLRQAIQAVGIKGIQYLPVKVYRPNGEELAGFAIANIVERRRALDRLRSDIDEYPEDYFLPDRRGKVQGIRKAVLKADALRGCDIIRLDEFLSSVYVSERFKKAFEIGRFTGYSFREVETS